MASTKDLKKRIGSVKNTQQTTKAMKVVSAAKLRRSQEAIVNHRPYAREVEKMICELVPVVGSNEEAFPLLARGGGGSVPAGVEGRPSGKLALVLVTSDRGLCGGFNGNVIRAASKWIEANRSKYQDIELSFVGRRGFDYFKSRKYTIGTFYSEITGKIRFQNALTLADTLIARFLAGEICGVKFVYTEFKNAVSQIVTVEGFLPFDAGSRLSGSREASSAAPDARDRIVKPTATGLMEKLLEKNFAIQAFRILLESQASEHGARMSAMENATKNAGEMIRKLTLQYNKQRQAGITKELLEIISGSESQKSA